MEIKPLKEGEQKGNGTVDANKFPDHEMYANDNKKIITLLEQQLVEMKAIKEAVSYLVSIIREKTREEIVLPVTEITDEARYEKVPRY